LVALTVKVAGEGAMEEQTCRKKMSGKELGLAVFIESWSGSSSEDICNLRGRDDAKHMVKVTNLDVYPLDVECTGQILSNPRTAKFSCASGHSVTENEWTADTREIEEDGGYHYFGHVSLLCTDLSGFERVHTKLRCVWLDKSRDAPPVVFRVNT
jgi:hypothetical protein